MSALILQAALTFLLGVVLGRHLRRASEQDLKAEIDMWRSLANAATAAVDRARTTARQDEADDIERTRPPLEGGAPPSPPNALHVLRTRLDFGRGEIAQGMGVPIADVEALEHTRSACSTSTPLRLSLGL